MAQSCSIYLWHVSCRWTAQKQSSSVFLVTSSYPNLLDPFFQPGLAFATFQNGLSVSPADSSDGWIPLSSLKQLSGPTRWFIILGCFCCAPLVKMLLTIGIPLGYTIGCWTNRASILIILLVLGISGHDRYWFLVLFLWIVAIWRFVELEQWAIQSPAPRL